MEILVWLGAAVSLFGLGGLIWCITKVLKARKAGLSEDELREVIRRVVPINSGAVVTCRPVGLLRMEDESGEDAKILADGGMTFVSHSPEAGAVYQKMADDAAWARMYERIDGGGAGADTYNALRKAYAGE